MSAVEIVAVAAAVGAGMVAGLLFVFSNFAMRSIDRAVPGQRVRLMQAVNEDIVNPVFVVIFAGTAASSAVLLVAGAGSGNSDLVARFGAIAYLLGVIGVTAVFNIPMNNRLAEADPRADDAGWAEYRRRWTLWNHVRCVAAVVASVCFVLSLAA